MLNYDVKVDATNDPHEIATVSCTDSSNINSTLSVFMFYIKQYCQKRNCR